MEVLLPPTQALSALPSGEAHVGFGPAGPRDFCCALASLPRETAGSSSRSLAKEPDGSPFYSDHPVFLSRALGLFSRLSLNDAELTQGKPLCVCLYTP